MRRKRTSEVATNDGSMVKSTGRHTNRTNKTSASTSTRRRKRKTNRVTSIVDTRVYDSDLLTYSDEYTPYTFYTMQWVPNTKTILYKQVSKKTNNVLCSDYGRVVDLLTSLHYNRNANKIVVCYSNGAHCYDFDKNQLIDYVNKYNLVDMI